MNTPVSGGAVSDEQINIIRQALMVADRLAENAWSHDFKNRDYSDTNLIGQADDALDQIAAVLTLTQPAVPVLASEPVPARLAHALQHAKVASQLLMEAHAACPETWRGYYDDALNHVDIAVADLEVMANRATAAAPQPAPTPSDGQIADAIPTTATILPGAARKVCMTLPELREFLVALAAPLASEPEPVAAEQARESDSEVPAGMGGWLTNGAAIHPRTLNLVVRFSRALAANLDAAEIKYGYSDGWLLPDWMDECRAKLMEHVAKGDPRDVAAYCAFLWHHGSSTSQSTPPPESAGQGLSDAAMLDFLKEKTNVARDWQERGTPFFVYWGDKPIREAITDAILAANRTAQQDGGSKA